MLETKLLRTLKTLNSSELRIFKRFLSSKLYNQHPKVNLLFDYLRKELKAAKADFSKATIHQQLFPGEPFNDKQVRDVCSYLFKALEKFLIHQEVHADDSSDLLALCKAYRKRNLPKLFDTVAKKVKIAQEKSSRRDVDYHIKNYQLQQEQYYGLINKERAKATNLQEVSDSLDISYFANRLRQSCIMLAHQSVYKVDYELGMVEAVIKEVERLGLSHIPAIGIYYNSYLAQTKTDNTLYFKELKKDLIENSELFDRTEMRDIYLLAINIGIKNLNKGKMELMPEILALYKSGIEKKILLNNNILSRFTYKNTIALALRSKEFAWVTAFIKDYTPLLDEQFRADTYRYNLAKLHYAKKEYADALQLLMLTSSSDDVYVNLDTKMLLSRIYYEQNELDLLDALAESFKTFLRRKKILGYHRESYGNFLFYLNKLMTVNPFDKKGKLLLREEIEGTSPLPEKEWLLLCLEG